MTLISLLLTWAVIQLRGSVKVLQRDAWFLRWQSRLHGCQRLSNIDGGVLFVALVMPLLLLALLSVLLVWKVSPLLIIFINIPVLLYSFGRADTQQNFSDYIAAWRRDDSAACVNILLQIDSELSLEALSADTNSWAQLHRHALRTFAYSGFERMFAVLFWFLLLGAAGALLYRLSSLFVQSIDPHSDEQHLAAKWLWLLEWPAVRVLGLSLAMVGNFVGCFSLWREHLFCLRQSSAQMLLFSVQGALGLEAVSAEAEAADSDVECAQVGCSGHQVEALQALLSRALLLWVSAVALFTLFV